jgi:hypothetical protein
MYTIYDCAACVVVGLTLSTFLCALYVVLLTIKWGIERLWRTSDEIRSMERPIRTVLENGASMASMVYRSRVLVPVASSDPMIRDSVQRRRPSFE